jgi:hypothetical protein
MRITAKVATRLKAWARYASDAWHRLSHRAFTEICLTVDVSRLRQAHSSAERVAAVSWPRMGALAITPLALLGTFYAFHALTRPDAYPPPDPTQRQVVARAEALRMASRAPPPALVEANKSWTGE